MFCEEVRINSWVYTNHSNGYNIYMFYLLFYSSVLYLTFSIVITLF